MQHTGINGLFDLSAIYGDQVATRTFRFNLPDPFLAESWIEVTDGGLPQPVEVRVGGVADSLHLRSLKFDCGQEITSVGLRQVRLGDLLDQLTQHLTQ